MDLLEARPVWSMSGSELLTTLDTLHTDAAQREIYRLQLMARLDEIGHAQQIGARNTAELLSMRHRLDTAAVQRDLKLALALPMYAAVSAALPDPFAPTSPDGTLQYTDPRADPDGPDCAGPDLSGPGPVAAAEAARRLPVLLHPAQANAIVTALEKVPTAAMVPVEDLRAAEEQMVEAARHLPPAELRKLGNKVRDLLDADGSEPADDRAYRKEKLWLRNADHGIQFGGFLAAENAELLKAAVQAQSKPRKTVDGQLDPRPPDKRQADGLVTLLHLAATASESAGCGGSPFKVLVTMDLTDLKTAGARATGDVAWGDGLSAAAVRRLACDARVIPLVLGSDSRPLDVGMTRRFVTGAIGDALVARDKGCVICNAPPVYCHAHHLRHWIDGGETSVDNLVLVCGAHHTAVHQGHWTITITNGIVTVSRPAWADPHPRTRHRNLTFRPRRDPGASSDAGRSGSRVRCWPDPSDGDRPGDPGGPNDPGGPCGPGDAGGPGSWDRRWPDPHDGVRSGGPGGPSDAGGPGYRDRWPDPDDPNHGDRPGEPVQPGGWREPGDLAEPVRAWPMAGDLPWPSPEEAARLNPWGDDEPTQRTATPPPTNRTDDTTWTSPWTDDTSLTPGP